MSKSLDPSEFSKARDRAVHSCTPVVYRTQQAWLGDWRSAIGRMQYLQLHQSGISDSLKSLIQLRGGLKKPNLDLNLVKPDVERLWNEMTDQAEEASHTFVNTDTGFECSFYAVSFNSYITGTFQVERYRG